MIKKGKKINKPGRIFNPVNIKYIDIIDSEMNHKYDYDYDKELFYVRKYSAMGEYANDYNSIDDIDKNCFVKNNNVYFKPNIIIYYIGSDDYNQYYFDTLKECYSFVKSLNIC